MLNFDELRRTTFTNGEVLIHFVKRIAIQNGFQVYSRDSSSASRIRICCSKHQIHKNVTRSKKSECPFRLYFNRTSNGNYKISPNSIFDHSHPLDFVPEVELEEETQTIIKSMKDIGISNFHIICYIERKFNISITVKDIQKVMHSEILKNQISETEAMFNYMENKGNLIIFQNNEGITGYFTLTNEEKSNLQKFGDFIEIDGTSIPNYLNWTIIPISLQGNYKELLYVGIAFTASESKEFY